ncbi:GNAT family N-acetyltransferase [Anaerolentibacter hominis]|uniref:GNAT family N-acetyltransferase n=1 Tax=Anaerolentibacter hominis TaxID=3079009 RepID=UPI0031B898C4
MNINFEPVNPDNRNEIEHLQLLPEQVDFIESVKDCLAEADKDKSWRPVGIYDNETLIGFAMYGYFDQPQPNGQVWLDRFLIDQRYQGKGYGAAAVNGLLEKLFGEYDTQKIYLSVYEENKAAIHLYEKSGFRFNGEVDTKGEKVMVCGKMK